MKIDNRFFIILVKVNYIFRWKKIFVDLFILNIKWIFLFYI